MSRRAVQLKEYRRQALAASIAQKKRGGAQGLRLRDNRAEAATQGRLRDAMAQSPRARAGAAVQDRIDHSPIMAAQGKLQRKVLGAAAQGGVLQRYTQTKDGKMVSSQKNLVLEAEASKEFYATDVGFSKNKQALERGGVKNVEFTKGNAKTYDELPERPFSKVLPVFKNITDTRVKSDTTLTQERIQAQAQIPPWYDPFWLWAQLVNIGSGFQPRFYQEYMRSVSGNQGKVDEIGREIQARDTKNEYIAVAIDVLDEVLNKVNDNTDDEIQDISSFFAQPPGVQNVIEKTTMHFVKTNWSKQSNKQVREGLKQCLTRRKAELEQQDNDPNAPYLPTDCQKLSLFLRGDQAQKIDSTKGSGKPKVGDYHHIDYSKRQDPNGPWDYHYGAILFKDGADTVTLEDAAGQGTAMEKGHWYFMMYGTKGKQTFKAKTDEEYSRRSKIAR